MSDDSYEKARRLLAATVRRRRKQLGLTQESAAYKIGIATRHYQKLEAGELNITLRTLCRVALAFNIDLSDLFETHTEARGSEESLSTAPPDLTPDH